MTTTNTTTTTRHSQLVIFSFFVFFLRLSSASSTEPPKPRSYHSHAYYVIETFPTHPSSSLQDTVQALSDALGTQFVERVGQLDDFWLVSAPKSWVDLGHPFIDNSSPTFHHHRRSILDQLHQQHPRDAIIERFELMRRSIHDPQLESELDRFDQSLHQRRSSNQPPIKISNRHLIRSIRSIERQVLRKRHKRDSIYVPSEDGSTPIIARDLSSYSPSTTNQERSLSLSQIAAKKFNIHDPLWPKQWHLVNDIIPHHMINATGVWDIGVTGKNVSVAIVDDGLDMTSDDLKANFFEKGSWDYNDHTPLPEPRLPDDLHGTRCAGEIAAIRNDVCGVGVAYDAKVAGIRILSASISDADEASALNYGFQENHIYSCSWGPPDDGKSMEAPSRLIFKAMLNGIQKGRGGKGSVFVFASGNGGAVDDQCNFDGYTNSIYSITISAIDRQGLHPYYSEVCSANMAVTYSSGSGDNIHTTDVGKNKCTDRHGGTSAAAPLGAGIFALVLEARPDLTWRDVQYLTVRTAIPFNLEDPEWQRTSTGRLYNHKFGFGNLDAYQIVQAAKTWKLVKPQAWWTSPNVNAHSQPVTRTGANATIIVTQADLDRSNFQSLEHITVAVNIKHGRRGNVRVLLISPHGTISILATHRRYDDASTGFPGWVFMTVKHWGENPIGAWTLSVQDPHQDPGKNGTFEDWAIGMWGECKDPTIQKLFKMPDDAEIILPPSPVSGVALETVMPGYISSAHAATASPTPFNPPPLVSDLSMGLSKTKSYAKPTAHLPIDHAGSSNETTGDRLSGFGGMTSYLKSKSSWVFVAFGIAIVLGGVLCGWFFLIRMRKNRRRLGQDGFLHSSHHEDNGDDVDQGIGLLSGSTRHYGFLSKLSQLLTGRGQLFGAKVSDPTSGNGYGFEPVAGEDDLPMRSMVSGPLKHSKRAPSDARSSRPSKPTTKELYDAFGHQSDEEDTDDDNGQQDGDHLNKAASTSTSSYSDIKVDDEYMDSFLEDEDATTPHEKSNNTKPTTSLS